jgi:hypothetical protein
MVYCCVHSFFLLSNDSPDGNRRRLHQRGDKRPLAPAIQFSRGSGKRDNRARGDAVGAILAGQNRNKKREKQIIVLAGSPSNYRPFVAAGDGDSWRVNYGCAVKKAKTPQHHYFREGKQGEKMALAPILPGFCGKLAWTRPGNLRGSANFPQCPSNYGGRVSPAENRSGVAERSGL